MIPNLVSIITPCYNTGYYLPRLLDSILLQDYPLVEMFAIDDGSTDNTKSIIEKYISKFAEKGYTLNYVYQTNAGQSVAINNGLKLINGEYLVWPDSDDWYSTRTALTRMVQIFKDTDPTVSMVRCLAEYISEKTLETTAKVQYTNKSDLFEDCLFAKNGFWYCAGGYMCKTLDIRTLILNSEIFTHKDAGQNWQLMLPLLYGRKCITINEYHYKILQRSQSHSRGQFKTYNEQIIKINTYELTIISTLERMYFLPLDLKNNYIKQIKIKYYLEKYQLAYFYNIECARVFESQLYEIYGVSIPLKRKFRLLMSRCLSGVKKCLFYDKNS